MQMLARNMRLETSLSLLCLHKWWAYSSYLLSLHFANIVPEMVGMGIKIVQTATVYGCLYYSYIEKK